MKKTLTRILGAGLGLTLPFLSGCQIETAETAVATTYIEGTVVEEYGRGLGLEESSGAWFGNESVRIVNPSYTLKIQTSEGVYTASVYCSWTSRKTLEALSAAIEPGTKIRFAKRYKGREKFDEDKIGTIRTDELTVLGSPKKE